MAKARRIKVKIRNNLLCNWRLIPSLSMKKRKSKLRTCSVRIKAGFQDGTPFKKGDLVLDIFLDFTNPTDTVLLSKKLGELEPTLKQKGYPGFVGDAPNSGIARYLVEKRGFVESGKPIREAELQSLRNHEKEAGKKRLSCKVADASVKRMLKKFG